MMASKPFQTQNFYELLDVPATASQDEIRAAYEKSMELYGTDSVAMYALNDDGQVDELRSRLLEAWKVLGDRDLRGAYDQSLGFKASVSNAVVASVAALVPPVSQHKEQEPAQQSHETERPAAADLGTSPPAFVELAPPGDSVPPPASPSPEPKALAKQGDIFPGRRDESAEAKAKSEARAKVEIPPEAEFNGELLRRVRESRGLTVSQIADKTRIASRHIESIEADRHKDLPAPVYLRGILMNISRELGLDGLRVSKSYMELAARSGIKK